MTTDPTLSDPETRPHPLPMGVRESDGPLALPTLARPLALRGGLTAAMTFSQNTGKVLSVILEGLDDGFRPTRIMLQPAQIIRLAALCAQTLPEGDR